LSELVERPEGYWPLREWGVLEQEAKEAIASNDEVKILSVRRRMNLLNPTFLVPPGEISDVWKWCLGNLGEPFKRWKPEDIGFYEKLSRESLNLLERARSGYAVWTLTRKFEYAEIAVRSFLESVRSYLAKKWYQEYDMIAFSFEIAGALSLRLRMKPPLDFPGIVDELARVVSSLDSANVRGPAINSLTDAAARLANRVSRQKDRQLVREALARILGVALKLADENPLNEGFLEPCVALSLIVAGPESANKVKQKMADSLVAQANAQGTNLGRAFQYQQAMKLYSEVGNTRKLEECKLAIRQAMEEAEKREIKTITVKVGPISKEKIVRPYMEKLSSKTPIEVLDWLGHDFLAIPSRKKIDEATRRSLSDKAGLFVSSVIPYEGSLPKGQLTSDESKIALKVDQNLALAAQGYEFERAEVLKATFETLVKPEDLAVFMEKSENINPNSKKLITTGIVHHFDKQYHASISILIPQVEEVLRTFLKRKGVLSSRYSTRDQGLQERMIDDLLKDTTGHLNQEFIDYLTVRMTPGHNGGGSNVRNRVCHGWMEADRFTPELSWAVIDTLLKLCVA